MGTVALFDLDGTLVDSVDGHARAWTAAFGEHGYDVSFDRIRSMIGMGGDRILPAIDERLSARTEPGRSIAARRRAIFLEREVALVEPTPGAGDLLRALRARGTRAFLATSANAEDVEALLRVAGLIGLVEPGGDADAAGASKPAPGIVQAALAAAGAAPAEAVFIGDTRYDVEAAHRAGVRAIALRCGGMDETTLGDAEAVYDDPAALLARLDGSPLGAGS